MKCPMCNGSGVDDDRLICYRCGGSGVIDMTNEEWLRTLPADERVKEVLSRGFMTEKRTAEEFVKWLEEKHDGN